MEWVRGIDEAFLVPDRDAVFADEEKFRLRNGELLAVSRAYCKRAKPAAQPLFQFLHVHVFTLWQAFSFVKIVAFVRDCPQVISNLTQHLHRLDIP